MSPPKQEELREQVVQMLQDNIIRTSTSPWAAPVVMVPKRDGTSRLCVDYRALNEITTPDRYPLPRMDDLIYNGLTGKVMTTIDLKSGYWQIPVAKEDQEKTAFVCPFGLFEFQRMPFGLRNAPATFQRTMDRLRARIPHVRMLAYLDDIIIFSDRSPSRRHRRGTIPTRKRIPRSEQGKDRILP